MGDKNLKHDGATATRDAILGSLSLLDERGEDERISTAMAIVHEAFSAAAKGEHVGNYELLQRARWADQTQSRNAARGSPLRARWF